jgi:hypothetical protein
MSDARNNNGGRAAVQPATRASTNLFKMRSPNIPDFVFALKDHVRSVAPNRKPGYLDAYEKLARTSEDGQWWILSRSDWQAIRKKYSPGLTLSKSQGLGDMVHRIAAPIGQLIRWPCMKRDASGAVTQDLRPNSRCAKLRRGLNAVKV